MILSKAITRLGIAAAAAALVLSLVLASAGSASAKELSVPTGKGLTADQYFTVDNTDQVAMKGGPASSVDVGNTTSLLEHQFSINPVGVIDPWDSANVLSVVDLGSNGLRMHAALPQVNVSVNKFSAINRLDELRAYKVTGSSIADGKCDVFCNPASVFVTGGTDPVTFIAVNTLSNGNYGMAERYRPSTSSVSSPSRSDVVLKEPGAVSSDENATEEPKSGNAGLLGTDGGNGGLWLLLGFAAVAGAAVAGRQLYNRREG